MHHARSRHPEYIEQQAIQCGASMPCEPAVIAKRGRRSSSNPCSFQLAKPGQSMFRCVEPWGIGTIKYPEIREGVPFGHPRPPTNVLITSTCTAPYVHWGAQGTPELNRSTRSNLSFMPRRSNDRGLRYEQPFVHLLPNGAHLPIIPHTLLVSPQLPPTNFAYVLKRFDR